jgi:hypothetical protein
MAMAYFKVTYWRLMKEMKRHTKNCGVNRSKFEASTPRFGPDVQSLVT